MPGRKFDPATYVAVQTRLATFWANHPEGRIETELMSPPDNFDQCRYVARVYRHRDNPHPDAAGWATETAGTSFADGANWGSHEENAETSAIGRALANFGYATTADDRMSREEAEKVNRWADAPARVTPTPPTTPLPAAAQQPHPFDSLRASPERVEGTYTVSWTVFWKEMREIGIADGPAYAALTGRNHLSMTPQEAIDAALDAKRDLGAVMER